MLLSTGGVNAFVSPVIPENVPCKEHCDWRRGELCPWPTWHTHVTRKTMKYHKRVFPVMLALVDDAREIGIDVLQQSTLPECCKRERIDHWKGACKSMHVTLREAAGDS